MHADFNMHSIVPNIYYFKAISGDTDYFWTTSQYDTTFFFNSVTMQSIFFTDSGRKIWFGLNNRDTDTFKLQSSSCTAWKEWGKLPKMFV